MDAPQTAQPRKRRRPRSACVQCHRRKIKCDRKTPCDHCIRSKSDACIYDPVITSVAHRKRSRREFKPAPLPSYEEDIFDVQSWDTIAGEDAHATAVRLSDALAKAQPNDASLATVNSPPLNIQPPIRNLLQLDRTQPDATNVQPSGPSVLPSLIRSAGLKGTFSKNRLLGQSHWMNTCQKFTNIIDLLIHIESGKSEEISMLLDKCKRLGRSIKAQEFGSQAISSDFRDYLPPKETADNFLRAYLRTLESVYRVLHVPSFQREYDEYWEHPQLAGIPFVIKLLLVLAIGSCFHQDPVSRPSQRISTLQWIYTAQSWLSLPIAEKSRMTITGIQIHCLLLIARETNAVGGDLIWVSAGSLLRTAMLMGLHRDPSHIPGSSAFQMEMRRRLWATILELSLQSCMNIGGSPLISHADYDCQVPSNIDDAQMDIDIQSPPIPKPKNVYTQTTLQIALMRTLPLRLRIAHIVNDFRSEPTYDETIRLGSELRKVYSSTTQFFESSRKDQAQPSAFQVDFFDILNCRSLLILHYKFAEEAITNPVYYYSRKVCIETSLALLAAESPSDPDHGTTGGRDEDMYCLKRVGGGVYRGVPLHAFLIICLELMTQLRESQSPFTSAADSMARQELFEAAQGYTELGLERLKAGETNIKGHVFTSCIVAQISALRTGAAVERAMLNVLREKLEFSYVLLRERAGRSPTASSLDYSPIGDQQSTQLSGDLWTPFGEALSWDDMDSTFNVNFPEPFT